MSPVTSDCFRFSMNQHVLWAIMVSDNQLDYLRLEEIISEPLIHHPAYTTLMKTCLPFKVRS